jgi:hypothetical protein
MAFKHKYSYYKKEKLLLNTLTIPMVLENYAVCMG